MAKRQRIIDELVETEKSFVIDLFVVTEPRDKHMAEVRDLLVVMNGIRRFNRRLLREFKRADSNCGKIAETFLRSKQGFDVYLNYCTCLPRANARLMELRKRAAFSESLCHKQRDLGMILPLESYLLKPLQRILKYPLLLKNLLENYFEPPSLDREEFVDLQRAYDLTLQISNRLNEHRKDLEQKQTALFKIPSRLDFPTNWMGCFKLSMPMKPRRTRSTESLRTLISLDTPPITRVLEDCDACVYENNAKITE